MEDCPLRCQTQHCVNHKRDFQTSAEFFNAVSHFEKKSYFYLLAPSLAPARFMFRSGVNNGGLRPGGQVYEEVPLQREDAHSDSDHKCSRRDLLTFLSTEPK